MGAEGQVPQDSQHLVCSNEVSFVHSQCLKSVQITVAEPMDVPMTTLSRSCEFWARARRQLASVSRNGQGQPTVLSSLNLIRSNYVSTRCTENPSPWSKD